MENISDKVRELASKIRLLALDSDGVLTDGSVYILDDGREFRRFDIKDGLGLKRIMAAGIQVVIISGSTACPIKYRALSLGISEIFLGIENKLLVLQEVCGRLNINLDEVAYMGDDLPDLSVFKYVGLPCAPSDASERILEEALFVTSHSGGRGAVRELCNMILWSKIK